MEKIRKDRHQSHTSRDIITSRTTSHVNSHENRLGQGLTNYHDVRHHNLLYLLQMEKSRNDRSLYTDVVLFFFSKTSASASSSSPHPLMLGSINPTAVLFFVTRAQRTLKRKQRAFEQATMIFTRVLNLSNVAFLANLFRFKDGFSKLQMISKTKAFPYIFLRFSSRSSLTLNSAISLFFTQIVIFSIFSSAHRLDDLPQADLSYQTSLSDPPQIRPPRGTIRSDRHTRPSDQTATPDHQIRSPHQTTDHHP